VRTGGCAYVAISEYGGPLGHPRPVGPLQQSGAGVAQRRNRQELERLRYRLWGAADQPGLPDAFNRDTFASLIGDLTGGFTADLIEFRRNYLGGDVEYIAVLRKL